MTRLDLLELKAIRTRQILKALCTAAPPLNLVKDYIAPGELTPEVPEQGNLQNWVGENIKGQFDWLQAIGVIEGAMAMAVQPIEGETDVTDPAFDKIVAFYGRNNVPEHSVTI